MLSLRLPDTGPLTLLCLGAHADDIEIGCAGTLLTWVASGRQLRVVWVVFSGTEEREREARESAARLLASIDAQVDVHHFRDGYFPYEGAGIKDVFEALGRGIEPDVVFTHHGRDRHQDHRVISELTWNTFRNHMILEYEVPKYDGDLVPPNCYVHLDESVCGEKGRHLLSCFPSQSGKPWFRADTFLSLARLRGIECAAPSGYAEGFHARKLVLRP